MLQSESIKFLENCIEKVENASPEQIENIKKAYNKNMKYNHLSNWKFILEERVSSNT